MICIIMYSQSCLGTAALIFYTCVWIPFHQLKKSLFHLLDFLLCSGSPPEQTYPETASLPAARYEDVKLSGNSDGEAAEEACAICLVELESEDVVSKLPKCGHVFHLRCMEKWVERDQLTCPLCRAFLFSSLTSSSHGKYCCNFSPHSLSNLDYSFLSF